MSLISKSLVMLTLIFISELHILVAMESNRTQLWDPWGHPYNVYVYNRLAEGHTLTLHCKSKDDDLGVKYIPYNSSYNWYFNGNFWGTTLFFCGFQWRNGRGVYDIFIANRDRKRCQDSCIWYAKLDGLHGINTMTFKEDIFYQWSKL